MEKQSVVGNYVVGKLLGKGTSGRIYRATDILTGQVVAIKSIFYDPDKGQSHPKAEAEIMNQLNHPNILKLYDFFEIDNDFRLIMEYCEHGDLRRFISHKFPDKKVPEHQVQKIVQQICAGLKAMRELNILHRDLKPDNILIDHGFNLKIADFGSAKVQDTDCLFNTCVGTRIYMSPEVLFWEPYAEKCDIWPIGIMIYQMIYGKLPYYPEPQSEQELLKIIEEFETPTFPPETDISPMLKDLIISILRKDPYQRIDFGGLFNHPWISGVGFSPIITNEITDESVQLNCPNDWYPETSPEFKKRYYQLVQEFSLSGDYVLRKTIKQRDSKTVFKGFDRMTKIGVVVHRYLKNTDEARVHRIFQVLQLFDHLGFPKLIEYCQDEEHHYIIVELCENGSLEDFINRRFPTSSIPEFQAYILIKALLEIILQISEKKIVHPEISLKNILLDADYHPKIIGFGSSFNLTEIVEPTEKNTKMNIATPPEVFEGQGYHEKSIIWSWAVVFHQILTGSPPFSSQCNTKLEGFSEFPGLNISSSGISFCAHDLLSRMLVREPEKRISIKEIMQLPWFTKMENVRRKYGQMISKSTLPKANWYKIASNELKQAYEQRVHEVGQNFHYLHWEEIVVEIPMKITSIQETQEQNSLKVMIQYADGSTYDGEYKDGKRHGRGKMVFKDGSKYDGDWKADNFEGQGEFTWPSGAVYNGSFKNGQREGEGSYKYKDLADFAGMCSNDLIHGSGAFTWKDGRRYEGEWVNGSENGMGFCVYPDCSGNDQGKGSLVISVGGKYKGMWQNGKRHGKGTYVWSQAELQSYVGDWVHGEKCGHGELFFTSGEKYEGAFKNDQMHGEGKYIWPSQHVYEGSWVNGVKQGHGKLKCPRGEKYIGEWKNNTIEGLGQIRWQNGEKFVGYFKNIVFKDIERFTGEFEGLNGKKYIGEWKNLMMHGQGEYINPDGTRYVGESVNGKKCGRGEAFYANGETYNGEWFDNDPHGYGQYDWPDGRQIVGHFHKGVPQMKGSFKQDKNPENENIQYIWPYWKWTSKMQNGFAKVNLENGSVYEGYWMNGTKEGKGTMIWPNKEKYVGDWVQGKQEGRGEMIYADGSKYRGEWHNNLRHGKGELVSSEKEKYIGDWVHGVREGFGRMKYATREEYTGYWKNDVRHGKGTLIRRDKRIDEGQWVNGKQEGFGLSILPDGTKCKCFWDGGVLLTETKITRTGSKSIK